MIKYKFPADSQCGKIERFHLKAMLLWMVMSVVGLLAMAAVFAVTANMLRPAKTRLPWAGDFSRQVETRAFQAGIPVTFLEGVRLRVGAEGTFIFDARTPELYEIGHLPGAFNLPIETMEQRLGEHVERLRTDSPIVTYCSGADCGDGLDLALKLRELGFTDLTLYPGGFAEWVEYGGIVRVGIEP